MAESLEVMHEHISQIRKTTDGLVVSFNELNKRMQGLESTDKIIIHELGGIRQAFNEEKMETKELHNEMKKEFVTQIEFKPIKDGFYKVIWIVITGVIASVLALIGLR